MRLLRDDGPGKSQAEACRKHAVPLFAVEVLHLPKNGGLPKLDFRNWMEGVTAALGIGVSVR